MYKIQLHHLRMKSNVAGRLSIISNFISPRYLHDKHQHLVKVSEQLVRKPYLGSNGSNLAPGATYESQANPSGPPATQFRSLEDLNLPLRTNGGDGVNSASVLSHQSQFKRQQQAGSLKSNTSTSSLKHPSQSQQQVCSLTHFCFSYAFSRFARG